ncbi:MAG: T9SS type A sorting domain-containing protein, partial [Bacteroidia bacterium]
YAANSAFMQLMPNPASNQLTINVSGLSKDQKSNLVMYDILGSVVLKDELATKDTQSLTYDITGLSKGVYIVEITNSTQKVVKRLIKQ